MFAGVLDPRSTGVRAYAERLSEALAGIGVPYRLQSRPPAGALCHFHLANSTRRVIPQAALHRRRFLVTVHDVMPRAKALIAVHRAIAPLCLARASTMIVHSHHAVALLTERLGIAAGRIEVVPHAANVPSFRDRAVGRRALGVAVEGPPLFVVPGTLKAAKLVSETLAAARPLMEARRMRLLLAGRVADERLAAEAASAGALLARDPSPVRYERAIVAADAVICVRRDTVGEANGPLLDAIGAELPSLITGVGSAPEVAQGSGRVVEPTVAGIREGLEALLDEDERQVRGSAARARAAELSWASVARRHAELLGELRGD